MIKENFNKKVANFKYEIFEQAFLIEKLCHGKPTIKFYKSECVMFALFVSNKSYFEYDKTSIWKHKKFETVNFDFNKKFEKTILRKIENQNQENIEILRNFVMEIRHKNTQTNTVKNDQKISNIVEKIMEDKENQVNNEESRNWKNQLHDHANSDQNSGCFRKKEANGILLKHEISESKAKSENSNQITPQISKTNHNKKMNDQMTKLSDIMFHEFLTSDPAKMFFDSQFCIHLKNFEIKSEVLFDQDFHLHENEQYFTQKVMSTEFSKIINLKKIKDASLCNSLSQSKNEFIQNFPHFKSSSMNFEHLTTTHDIDFTLINFVDLRGNSLENFTSNYSLSNIRKLTLCENKIQNFTLDISLQNLQILDLSKNNLHCFKITNSENQLESLNLAYNFLTQANKIILDCPNLTSINLAHNKISNLQFPPKLTKIETLNVSFNSVTSVSNLQSNFLLKELIVCNNLFTSFEPILIFPLLKNLELECFASGKFACEIFGQFGFQDILIGEVQVILKPFCLFSSNGLWMKKLCLAALSLNLFDIIKDKNSNRFQKFSYINPQRHLEKMVTTFQKRENIVDNLLDFTFFENQELQKFEKFKKLFKKKIENTKNRTTKKLNMKCMLEIAPKTPIMTKIEHTCKSKKQIEKVGIENIEQIKNGHNENGNEELENLESDQLTMDYVSDKIGNEVVNENENTKSQLTRLVENSLIKIIALFSKLKLQNSFKTIVYFSLLKQKMIQRIQLAVRRFLVTKNEKKNTIEKDKISSFENEDLQSLSEANFNFFENSQGFQNMQNEILSIPNFEEMNKTTAKIKINEPETKSKLKEDRVDDCSKINVCERIGILSKDKVNLSTYLADSKIREKVVKFEKDKDSGSSKKITIISEKSEYSSGSKKLQKQQKTINSNELNGVELKLSQNNLRMKQKPEFQDSPPDIKILNQKLRLPESGKSSVDSNKNLEESKFTKDIKNKNLKVV